MSGTKEFDNVMYRGNGDVENGSAVRVAYSSAPPASFGTASSKTRWGCVR